MLSSAAGAPEEISALAEMEAVCGYLYGGGEGCSEAQSERCGGQRSIVSNEFSGYSLFQPDKIIDEAV